MENGNDHDDDHEKSFLEALLSKLSERLKNKLQFDEKKNQISIKSVGNTEKIVPFSTQFAAMGILHIIRIMRFQMDFQIFVGFVVNTTDAAFEIFVAFMGAHMAINQKARREILPTDLATVKKKEKNTIYFLVLFATM